MRLTRADWQATHSVPVEIHGLAPCLPLFGVGAEDDTAEPTAPANAPSAGQAPASAG
jgi:hypothetical protein